MTDRELEQEVIEYVELEADTEVTSVEVVDRIEHLDNEAVIFSVEIDDDEVPECWVVGGETAMNLYRKGQFDTADDVFTFHVGLLVRYLSSRRHRKPSEPPEGEKYDVFLSHASEDKEPLVRPLAEELKERGLWVWYDDDVLELGDSIRRSIDNGLANSHCGIVVLSDAFFGKSWPEYELDGLVTKMNSEGESPIYQVWHEIGEKEVGTYSPPLAGKIAQKTEGKSVEQIAGNLHRVIMRHLIEEWRSGE